MFNFLFLNCVYKILFTKAYVLDFGTEVYSWIGRHTKGAPRKMAAEIGLEHYNKGKKKMGIFSLLVVLKTAKNQTWVLCFFKNVDSIEN